MRSNLTKLSTSIIAEGNYKGRVTFGNLEMSLYRLEGKAIEIWFDHKLEVVVKIQDMESPFNPFLKYISEYKDN